jgi:hypothetical protein
MAEATPGLRGPGGLIASGRHKPGLPIEESRGFPMKYSAKGRVAVLFAALAAMIAHVGMASADITNFEFQLVKSEVKSGAARIEVRLIDKRTGKPVPDALIFAKRIDMAPDRMPTMTAPLDQLPSTQPGIYAFKTELMMAGSWRLSLAAKVQGETETLQGELVIKATP